MADEDLERIRFEQRQRRVMYVVLASFLMATMVVLYLR